MGPEEITDLFETMAQGLRSAGTNAAGQPPASAAVAPPAEPAKAVDYKKLLDPNDPDFNPEQAFGHYVQTNYGRLIGDINTRSIRGQFATFRSNFSDFHELEPDIERILSGKNPATLTEHDISGAYFMAKGLKATMRERAEAAAKQGKTTLPPSPPAPPDPKASLSETERQVARKMFRNSSDPEGDYVKNLDLAEGGRAVSVPLGGGKRG